MLWRPGWCTRRRPTMRCMVAGRSMGHVPILVRRCSNLLLLLLVMVVVVSIAHATMCLLHVVAATVATTAIAALVAAVLLPHATTRVASWTAMLPTARIMVPALGVSWVAAPVAAVVAALCGTATLAGIHVRVLIVRQCRRLHDA